VKNYYAAVVVLVEVEVDVLVVELVVLEVVLVELVLLVVVQVNDVSICPKFGMLS